MLSSAGKPLDAVLVCAKHSHHTPKIVLGTIRPHTGLSAGAAGGGCNRTLACLEPAFVPPLITHAPGHPPESNPTPTAFRIASWLLTSGISLQRGGITKVLRLAECVFFAETYLLGARMHLRAPSHRHQAWVRGLLWAQPDRGLDFISQGTSSTHRVRKLPLPARVLTTNPCHGPRATRVVIWDSRRPPLGSWRHQDGKLSALNAVSAVTRRPALCYTRDSANVHGRSVRPAAWHQSIVSTRTWTPRLGLWRPIPSA